jgi:hypothetical protein
MEVAANVWADVTTPSNQVMQVHFLQEEQGTYRGKFVASDAGIYRARVRAAGKSLRGFPFLREQTLTVGVWIGGNNLGGNGGGSLGASLCHLLNCLFGEKGVVSQQAEEILLRLGFDITALRRCLAECAQSRIPLNERAPAAAPKQVTSTMSPAVLSLLEQFVNKPGQTGSQ